MVILITINKAHCIVLQLIIKENYMNKFALLTAVELRTKISSHPTICHNYKKFIKYKSKS